MLKQAVEAGLPLISVTTRDTVNAQEVIARILGKPLASFEVAKGTAPAKGSVSVIIAKPAKDFAGYAGLYGVYQKAEASLIIVNPPYPDAAFFDAGELMIPMAMKSALLSKAGVKSALVPALTRALGNVTIKETVELLRLTMVRDGTVTQKGLVRSRRDFFQGQSGLTQVLSDEGFYDPPAELRAYVESERGFFLKASDHRLIPRGLLFDGPPGTGKTAGAKYVAEAFGVPLFRLDLGSTQGKYVGDSENNLQRNLGRVDREEPCVLLIDEIEKIFGGSHDESGIMQRMMSAILWWLAEHRSRVFVIMTTNKRTALPPELYRERRIDRVMTFLGLEGETALTQFIVHALKTFDIEMPDPKNKAAVAAFDEAVGTIAAPFIESEIPTPQAKVYERVISEIKAMNQILDADA